MREMLRLAELPDHKAKYGVRSAVGWSDRNALLVDGACKSAGITPFLFATLGIHRRIAGAELELVEGNVGADVPNKTC